VLDHGFELLSSQIRLGVNIVRAKNALHDIFKLKIYSSIEKKIQFNIIISKLNNSKLDNSELHNSKSDNLQLENSK
jgi:hypothetical protein